MKEQRSESDGGKKNQGAAGLATARWEGQGLRRRNHESRQGEGRKGGKVSDSLHGSEKVTGGRTVPDHAGRGKRRRSDVITQVKEEQKRGRGRIGEGRDAGVKR